MQEALLGTVCVCGGGGCPWGDRLGGSGLGWVGAEIWKSERLSGLPLLGCGILSKLLELF